MVNNILIFRTDKIVDLLITCPVVLTIKKHLTNSTITLITSKNTHNYAKSFGFIDDIVMFPQDNLLEKFKFIISLAKKKYNYILILDGKDRSIILSKFLKVDKIFHTYPQKKINFFTKIFFSKKYTTFLDNQSISLKRLYGSILDKIGVKIIKKDYKILLHQNIKKINIFKKENISNKKYILIHLDEKWFSNFYIKHSYY